jgi:hypothetical protein
VLNGLKLNSVLLIPNKSSVKFQLFQPKQMLPLTHLVTKRDYVWYRKKYGVSGEDLRRANPFIEEEHKLDPRYSGKKQNNKYSCSSR